MFEVEWLMLRSCAVDFPAFSVPSSYLHSMFLHSVSKQAVPRHLHKCQCMDLPLREPVRGGGRSLSHCPLPPCLGLGTHVPQNQVFGFSWYVFWLHPSVFGGLP